jgi:oxygen-independent coproporphyrinogen-3 oxidase
MKIKEQELYVHIPFCMKKCNYCDFLSGVYDEKMRRTYTAALVKELEYLGKTYRHPLRSIYFGGGTPTWLETDCIQLLMDTIYKWFQVVEGAEITLECNPGTVTKDSLRAFHMMGFNRLSIGLQSANEEELKLLGRVHDLNRFLHTFELARNAGFMNINVDVMTGLPYQNPKKLQYTLDTVVRLHPEHISAYSLIIEKGTPFYDDYQFDSVRQEAGMQTEALPTEDQVYELTKQTEHFLAENGYRKYEISNFAKPGYEGEHNSGYWRMVPYLGAGLGASSYIDGMRFSNKTNIYDYIEASKKYEEMETSKHLWMDSDTLQERTRNDEIEEFMFLGLRMTDGVSLFDFEERFHTRMDLIYRNVIEELRREGLLDMYEGRVVLTERGMDLSNYAMAKFLLED